MKILKLGGSVITDKKARCKPNMENIKKLAKMLAQVWKKGVRDIVLVHGAGSFGHALVIEYGLDNGVRSEREKEGMRKTQEACKELSDLLVDELKREGVPALRIAPHEIIVQKNKRISKFDDAKVISELFFEKMPVLHGDMVADEKLGGSVCSGDQIVAYLAKKADFVVMGTNVDGITANGKLVEKLNGKNFSSVEKHLKKSDSPDVTGGMAGKVKELKNVGGKIFIANANYPQRIGDLLLGKKAKCTVMEF